MFISYINLFSNPVVENHISQKQIVVSFIATSTNNKNTAFWQTNHGTKICNAIFHYGVNPILMIYLWRMNIGNTIKKAPQTPGVYLFKNAGGRILYIGKAANLRARLRSYLHPGWKERMLAEASQVVWEELASDIEALIRESKLIKTHRPQYNILFRDDKNYFFVECTKDIFPRILLTHQPTEKSRNQKTKSTFIGPFTDGEAIKRVMRLLRNVFPYCTCSPRAPHARTCINAELGKCLGFCCRKGVAKAEEIRIYKTNINAIKKILSGKARALMLSLKKNMQMCAARQEYEKARTMRDQLMSLDRILKHSPYLKREVSEEYLKALRELKHLLKLAKTPNRIEGYDISHHQGDTSVASMVVFENGIPKKSAYRKFIMRSVSGHALGINDPVMIKEVLSRRLAHREWRKPDFILIDGGKGQLGAARAALAETHIRFGALAKREKELFIEGRKDPIRLISLPPPLLYLLTHVRDEAHRFAVSFHRRRRSRLVIPR